MSAMGYTSAQVPRQPVRDNHILLPRFTPTNRDVICGRARENFHHDGNRYFRDLINNNIGPYLSARTKIEKSDAIASIVDQVQKNSPLGGFVKKDSKTMRWLRIKESEARDKVGHAIRKAIQRLEDTRPKTIERLKNQFAASSLAQAARPSALSSSQEGGASSRTSGHIKEGEVSESDRSSTDPTPRGGAPIALHRESEQRLHQSRPDASSILAGLGNASLQQRLLFPHHLALLNRSSQLALPDGVGDPLSRTKLISRNFPLGTSQLVAAQRLLAQQNHHVLPTVSSPYEQSPFGHSLNGGSASGQHSSCLGRSIGESEGAKQARQDSLIIQVLQQQREQGTRKMKELECARRLVLEGGLLPGLAAGAAQQTGGGGGRGTSREAPQTAQGCHLRCHISSPVRKPS